MAKKKVNERQDYDLEARDAVVYKRSRIPRKMQFVILRGAGLNDQKALEENERIKEFAKRKRLKLKFLQASTVEAFLLQLNEANTWATGVVYHLGTLKDETQLIKKRVDRLLIPALEITQGGKVASLFEGLEKLVGEVF